MLLGREFSIFMDYWGCRWVRGLGGLGKKIVVYVEGGRGLKLRFRLRWVCIWDGCK